MITIDAPRKRGLIRTRPWISGKGKAKCRVGILRDVFDQYMLISIRPEQKRYRFFVRKPSPITFDGPYPLDPFRQFEEVSVGGGYKVKLPVPQQVEELINRVGGVPWDVFQGNIGQEIIVFQIAALYAFRLIAQCGHCVGVQGVMNFNGGRV